MDLYNKLFVHVPERSSEEVNPPAVYNLTRKGVPFEWTDEHQKIFEGLKKDIANPPVLVMPNNKGTSL